MKKVAIVLCIVMICFFIGTERRDSLVPIVKNKNDRVKLGSKKSIQEVIKNKMKNNEITWKGNLDEEVLDNYFKNRTSLFADENKDKLFSQLEQDDAYNSQMLNDFSSELFFMKDVEQARKRVFYLDYLDYLAKRGITGFHRPIIKSLQTFLINDDKLKGVDMDLSRVVFGAISLFGREEFKSGYRSFFKDLSYESRFRYPYMRAIYRSFGDDLAEGASWIEEVYGHTKGRLK